MRRALPVLLLLCALPAYADTPRRVARAVLAVSGAVMRGLFRNPLADSDLIGIASGAALAVAVAIVLHDLPLALRYADRGVVMKGGRVMACAAMRDALTPDVVAGVFEVPVHVVFAERGPQDVPQTVG